MPETVLPAVVKKMPIGMTELFFAEVDVADNAQLPVRASGVTPEGAGETAAPQPSRTVVAKVANNASAVQKTPEILRSERVMSNLRRDGWILGRGRGIRQRKSLLSAVKLGAERVPEVRRARASERSSRYRTAQVDLHQSVGCLLGPRPAYMVAVESSEETEASPSRSASLRADDNFNREALDTLSNKSLDNFDN